MHYMSAKCEVHILRAKVYILAAAGPAWVGTSVVAIHDQAAVDTPTRYTHTHAITSQRSLTHRTHSSVKRQLSPVHIRGAFCDDALYKLTFTFTHWRQRWIQHGWLCWQSTVAETGNKSATKSTVAETGNKSATKSTVAVYVQLCCQHVQLCCRYV